MDGPDKIGMPPAECGSIGAFLRKLRRLANASARRTRGRRDMSQRRFIRLFSDEVGLTPKSFSRIHSRSTRRRCLKLHRSTRPRPLWGSRALPLVLLPSGARSAPRFTQPDRRNLFASAGTLDPCRVDPATERAYKSWRRRPPSSCPQRLPSPSSRRLFSPL